LPEYDRLIWQITGYKLLKLGHWTAAPEVNGCASKKVFIRHISLN